MHPDVDLDMVLRLAWIFPEVFISIRLVKAKIDGLRLAEEAQISCATGGWVGGGWRVVGGGGGGGGDGGGGGEVKENVGWAKEFQEKLDWG